MPPPDDDDLQDIIDDAVSDGEGRPLAGYLRDHLAKHGWVIRAAADDLLLALKAMVNLVDSGTLVRDISRDHEAGFAVRQLPLVMTLKNAQEAIARAEGR